MATSANLPAGFSITTISGVRCTAVPRTATTLSGGAQTGAAKSTTETKISTTSTSITTESTPETTSSPPPPPTTSTTAAAVVNTQPPVIIPPAAVPTTLDQAPSSSATSTIASSVGVTLTSPPPAAITTAAPVEISSTFSTAISRPPDSPGPEISATALPITTPASPALLSTITPSTSPLPVALGDTLPSSSIAVVPTSFPSPSAGGSTTKRPDAESLTQQLSITRPAIATSSTGGDTKSSASSVSYLVGSESSGKAVQAGPIVGGVIGGLAGISLIAFLLFYLLRQRRKQRTGSLLTPLGTGRDSRFYEIDQGSLGPTKQSEKWRAEAGLQVEKIGGIMSVLRGKVSSLKTRVVGSRSDTPTVNLNRGQSQFLGSPFPQHSRSNSTASGASIYRLTVKDRVIDFAIRVREKLGGRSKEFDGPDSTARGGSEKQSSNIRSPKLPQLLKTDDRELHLNAKHRRASLTGRPSPSVSGLGSLDFGSSLDPFADPVNPFADPITQPKLSLSKENNYIADVRRSRGLSTDMTNQTNGTGIGTGAGGWRPPSAVPASRYPSTITPSRDSYRDTLYSTASSNARRGKGRSDPFDLERPELWRKPPPMPDARSSAAETASIIVGLERNSAVPPPLALNQTRGVDNAPPPRHASTGTYASKYSSGISLGGFGEPGPDIGSGSNSGASSLKEAGVDKYINKLERNSSVTSAVSSMGGVGKAR
ncbi:hypothetical protein PVAG01_03007 [Phlyctema vagabunda]|uniref:Uncharacterized protein n=1 Tax=Phlyctema vagabunda TaxID=108571 RepID=A0ABR4PSJ2_9HELO